jgi:hypothetical protein
VRLNVRYAAAEDFLREHESQMTRGGLLVRGDPPAGLALYDQVEVEIAGDFPALQAPVTVAGQVVQVFAGVGVAVAFDPAPLAAAVAAARSPGPPAAKPAPTAGAEQAAKIQLALHGNKDERMRIMRDTNRMLHSYVLKNPNLGMDEVLAIARMTTLSPELLAGIAERREWVQRPDIALSLVRNPKTPTPVAIKALDHVSPADLRQLAKDSHTRPQVQAAARKKVIT